jgi:hypothetical protein
MGSHELFGVNQAVLWLMGKPNQSYFSVKVFRHHLALAAIAAFCFLSISLNRFSAGSDNPCLPARTSLA